MTRYCRAEVDAVLTATKQAAFVPREQHVLACEVEALRERIDALTDQLRDTRHELAVAQSQECHCWDPWVTP